MSRRPTILPFLLINILVSALTTLGVLWLWNRYQPTAVTPTSSAPVAGQPTALQGELPALDTPVVKIEYAVGAGDLNQEYIRLSRVGEGELDLLGWKLEDGAGHEYIFGSIRLSQGGAMDLYTRAGSDSAIALYWGLPEAVWKTGVKAALKDWQGNLRAEYIIP
jgi:hypothetical protein